MDETLREQIALFRFGVISPLVSQPLAPGEQGASSRGHRGEGLDYSRELTVPSRANDGCGLGEVLRSHGV